MNTLRVLPLILACFLQVGCAALFTEQQYVLIEQPVTEQMVFYGEIYSIPAPEAIRKIVILGSGAIQNIEIHTRDQRGRWEPAKQIHGKVRFPFEILLAAETDAIKIIRRSTTGTGRIQQVQFYTIADVAAGAD